MPVPTNLLGIAFEMLSHVVFEGEENRRHFELHFHKPEDRDLFVSVLNRGVSFYGCCL